MINKDINNISLPPFYIGEEVTCKIPHSKNTKLIVGKKYIVRNMKKCSCGKWTINIGLSTTNGLGTTCKDCNDFLSLKNSGIAYFAASLFKSNDIIDISSLFFCRVRDKGNLILETVISIN